MNAYTKIRAALEGAKTTARICVLPGLAKETDEALAALAELERAAAEPVATVLGIVVEWTGEPPTVGTKLYTAPPSPVAEVREPIEVSPETCARVAAAFTDRDELVDDVLDALHDVGSRAQFGREMIAAVRSELGPTLGLAMWREPTPDECARIMTEAYEMGRRDETHPGRDLFDAARVVMFPHKSEVGL